MNTICICGAGTMGSGIAQVSAAAGFRTILYDIGEDLLQKAKNRMENDLDVLVKKQKIQAADKEALLQRMVFTADLNECIADVVIEAVIEKLEVKKALFVQLARKNAPETIFATNTSSLPVSAIAGSLVRPDRVAGLHFFNPASLMKLVEVVKGDKTSAETIASLVELTRSFGKTPVVCRDAPGFIVNRVARPYYIESLRLLEEGLASLETIDRLMEARGFRMGPFRLMDLIGNDVNYAVSCSVYQQLKEPGRLAPSYIQKQKVEQGELGRKSGKGYYTYTDRNV